MYTSFRLLTKAAPKYRGKPNEVPIQKNQYSKKGSSSFFREQFNKYIHQPLETTKTNKLLGKGHLTSKQLAQYCLLKGKILDQLSKNCENKSLKKEFERYIYLYEADAKHLDPNIQTFNETTDNIVSPLKVLNDIEKEIISTATIVANFYGGKLIQRQYPNLLLSHLQTPTHNSKTLLLNTWQNYPTIKPIEKLSKPWIESENRLSNIVLEAEKQKSKL